MTKLWSFIPNIRIREAKYKGETTKPMMDLSPSVVRNMEKCILEGARQKRKEADDGTDNRD